MPSAREFIMTELVTKSDLLAVRSELQTAIDTQTLRLTVRLGGIMIAGLGALALIQRLN